MCDCFQGWEGNDCIRRSCPKGPQIAGIANGTNSAHNDIDCSGRGECNYNQGTCTCYNGYYGHNCAKLRCMNDCSGRGECISMRQAAILNDGYLFNRSTTYNQWDADVIFGCRCDFGYAGADCSQKQCRSGIDPRLSSFKYETVTLVCDCAGTSDCEGRFKLQLYGEPTKIWLSEASYGHDVTKTLMTIPGMLTNIKAHASTPITSYNGSEISPNRKICSQGQVTKTNIRFNRVAGDIPAISFYANLFSSGSIYFETTQVLNCDCSNYGCNGTFRLSFDDQYTDRLLTWNNRSTIISALNSLTSITSSSIQVHIIDADASPVCRYGYITNTTIVFHAATGNVPRLGLWSSVVKDRNPSSYTTANATVLSLTTYNGRDDSVKECNGIGTCDYTKGICHCPYGWEADDDIGPCGKQSIRSSDSGGLGRCPGVVSPNVNEFGEYYDYTSRLNYPPRLFISINPTYTRYDGVNYSVSTIEYYDWNQNLPQLSQPNKHHIFLNLTSNASAGPLIIDQARNRLFFIDMNPAGRFIGIANLTQSFDYTVWISLSDKVFGFAMDSSFKRRKIYWTAPGESYAADGEIHWAYMDQSNPTIYSLSSSIGQSFVFDPMGIAIHAYEERIYWIDRNLSLGYSVIRSCDLDGSNYKQSYILQSVTNHSISLNLTDIKISYHSNNTAFIIDQSNAPAILAVNLNQPVSYPNDTNLYDQFLDFYDAHLIHSTWQREIGEAVYLALDDNISVVMWSDISLKRIDYDTYSSSYRHAFKQGTAYTALSEIGKPYQPYYPVGIVLDVGLGPPEWGDYLNCYGHGRCLNYTGNWECVCDKGYYGNCKHKICPTGPAWFHEPVADNIAHDVFVECSGMGVCDHKRGECQCADGFEGSACERMSCPGNDDLTVATCSNNGRCLSLRDMAYHRENFYGDPEAVIYGSKTYDAGTWDADMVYGCKADTYGYYHDTSMSTLGYIPEAYGLSANQYTCPKTYNPRSIEHGVFNTNGTLSYNMQHLYCTASSGYFQLSFRGEMTRIIQHNDSVASVETALKELTTIGDVDVEIQYGGSLDHTLICDVSSDTTAIITFMTELGSIPDIKISNNTLYPPSSISIIAVSRETSFLYECGGRGECNRANGQCTCWDHWATSDGFGKDGMFGDCGSNQIN